MSRSNSLNLFAGLLFLFFCIPYLLLLGRFDFNALKLISSRDLAWALEALMTSVLQSGFVVLICLALTFLTWRSVYSLDSRLKERIKMFMRLPMLLPSIFIILIGFQILNPFPFGFRGVTFLFFLTYFGFFFASLLSVIESRMSRQLVLKDIFSIGSLDFDRRVMFPQVSREIIFLSIVVFVGCFSSLSIPMIASGGKSTNFELFIYETIYIQNNFSAAVIFSVIQSLLLYLASRLVDRIYPETIQVEARPTRTSVQDRSFDSFKSYLSRIQTGQKLGIQTVLILIPILYLGLIYGIFGFRVFASLDAGSFNAIIPNGLFTGLMHSAILVAIVLGLIYALLKVKLFFDFRDQTTTFLRIFINPSTVVVGFSFYFLSFSWIQSEIIKSGAELIRLGLAMFIVYGISLYFTFLEPIFRSLKRQIMIARIYEISFADFFSKVAWPNLRLPFLSMSFFAILLICTEFALTKSLGAQVETLGTIILSYVSSYRLNFAFVFVVFVVCFCFISWFALKKLILQSESSETSFQKASDLKQSSGRN